MPQLLLGPQCEGRVNLGRNWAALMCCCRDCPRFWPENTFLPHPQSWRFQFCVLFSLGCKWFPSGPQVTRFSADVDIVNLYGGDFLRKVTDFPCKRLMRFVEENSARRYSASYICSPPGVRAFLVAHTWSPAICYKFQLKPLTGFHGVCPGTHLLESCFSLQPPVFPRFQVTRLSCDICSLVGSIKVIDLQFWAFFVAVVRREVMYFTALHISELKPGVLEYQLTIK